MKKISAIVLAIALVLMMSVPFGASAATTFSVPTVEAEVGAEGVVVAVAYEQTDWICNGKFEVTYDAEKLELIVPEKEGRNGVEADPNSMSKLPTAEVNVKGDGTVLVAFAGSGEIEESGDLITLTFNLKDTAAAGDELKIAVSAIEWIDDQDVDYIESGAIAAEGKIVVTEKATTTEAPATTTVADVTTTTEAPATTTAAPVTTTKAPTTAGDATPFALLATVAVAGAALVVLTGKKSK